MRKWCGAAADFLTSACSWRLNWNWLIFSVCYDDEWLANESQWFSGLDRIFKCHQGCSFNPNEADDGSFLVAGLSGDRFQFDEQGDGPARYNIIHFKQVSAGRYRWEHVGKYQYGQLQLDMKGKLGRPVVPPLTSTYTLAFVINESARLLSSALLDAHQLTDSSDAGSKCWEPESGFSFVDSSGQLKQKADPATSFHPFCQFDAGLCQANS